MCYYSQVGILESLKNSAPDIQAFKKFGQALDEGPPAEAIEDTNQWIIKSSKPEANPQDSLPEGIETSIINAQQLEK